MGLSELVVKLTVCGLLVAGALALAIDDDSTTYPEYHYDYLDSESTPDSTNYATEVDDYDVPNADEDENLDPESTPDSTTYATVDDYDGPNADEDENLDPESTPDSTTYATEELVTPEEPDCPPGKSYISHSDIRYAIDDLSSEFEKEYITKLLPRYEQMREIFKQEFENFKTFIINQPTRLKSVLENIARQREGMEPDMDYVVNALRGHSIYKKQYDMLLQEKTYILKNYERYRKNCQHSCEDEKTARLISTVAYPQRDGHTCISMQDLFQYIKQHLGESAAEFSLMADIKYQNIENDYRRKLDDVKAKLKQSALKAFGKPMFDVLSLQDALYQFTHNLELENLESILYEISTNILNTGIKLNVLNRKVKGYGMRCKSQNTSMDLFDGNKCTISAYPTETGHGTKIIDELVQEKFHDIEESVTSKYELILQELDAAMKDTEVGGIFSVIHPDVDDEIREVIQREQQAFGQLQRRVPDTVLKQFNILLQKTQEAL